VDKFFLPVTGSAYRVIPDGPPGGPDNDPLDSSFSARSSENRWNKQGEPTLYFAGDLGVAAAEWARHLEAVALPPEIVAQANPRRVWEVQIRVDRAIDLRDPRVWSELSLTNAPWCFTSIPLCQDTASTLRHTTESQALLVPSMAFLGKLDRWAMIGFVD
jgi:RES domain-containing protein